MGKLGFNAFVRRQLEEMVMHPENGRQLKRAQALLWVDDGEPIKRVAERLRIDRQSVYNWIDWINQRQGRVIDRLKDVDRSGRPREKSDVVDEELPQLLVVNPQEYGYRATGWTNQMLRDYIFRQHHLQVSHQTIREGIERAGYRWKRPRYVLSRRPPTWRQAKGGSKEGSKVVSAP
jgi:transposase